MNRDISTFPPGGSLLNYAPDFFIESMTVDNLSGSWLFCETLHAWIPPFTLGWRRNLQWQSRSVTIVSAVGPNGASISASGQPNVVTLTDMAAMPSDGVPYIASVPPSLPRDTSVSAFTASDTRVSRVYTLAEMGTENGKRARVYSILLHIPDSGATAIKAVYEVLVTTFVQGEYQLGSLYINPDRPADQIFFPVPFDLDVGDRFGFNYSIPIVGVPTGITQQFVLRWNYSVI